MPLLEYNYCIRYLSSFANTFDEFPPATWNTVRALLQGVSIPSLPHIHDGIHIEAGCGRIPWWHIGINSIWSGPIEDDDEEKIDNESGDNDSSSYEENDSSSYEESSIEDEHIA